MRAIYLGTLALVVSAGIVSAQDARSQYNEQRRRHDSLLVHDGLVRFDTSHLSIAIDGQPRSATAVAYMTEGQLFIMAHWRRDSTARYGVDALISSCVMRVPGYVGDHMVVVDTAVKRPHNAGGAYAIIRQSDTTKVPLFSAMYSGKARGGKAFAIYRSDWNGGSGHVTVTSLSGDIIRGNFAMVSVNADNPSETRSITGSFELPFQRILGEFWFAER